MIHPLCYGKQGNMIQPHGSNCYLGSPAQAGKIYINNSRTPLQEFHPHLQPSMQGFGNIIRINKGYIGVYDWNLMEN